MGEHSSAHHLAPGALKEVVLYSDATQAEDGSKFIGLQGRKQKAERPRTWPTQGNQDKK